MWRYWAFGLLALAGVTYAQDTECEEMVPIGPATGSLTRWTYDKSQNQCKAFITKETLTGRNIFLTEKECMSRCLVNYDQLFPPGDAVCELPMDSGPCLALVPMWYYNKEKDVCESFFWGGCQGNGNKFEIKDSCNSLCVTPKKGKSGANSNTSNESSESQSDAGKELL
ncbi:inter-alpha-trypsin inhibitor-like [Pyxicephalus adspersus]|uniref:inter-alpha-trypsin inhibitor-like n=1 Tax=Pyxicephalus adspersus TaxID=30357 RepID=UPI003B5AF3EA